MRAVIVSLFHYCHFSGSTSVAVVKGVSYVKVGNAIAHLVDVVCNGYSWMAEAMVPKVVQGGSVDSGNERTMLVLH